MKELEYEGVNFDDVGEETSDQLKVNVQDVSQAVIWGTDWTTETINRQLEKGNIDLSPTFQRRDAWSNPEKSCLIESLMLGIPVPQIILAENKTQRNTYIVIDGKQRLLSIRRFYAGGGQQNEENSFEPLKLSGLTVLSKFNGKTKKQIDSESITSFENQPIRTIIIKNWPDEEFLYTVFLRLNTGSKPLSPQELRQALKPGKFLKYLDDATANSEAMKKMLRNKGADSRMRDIELALRYFAFKYYLTDFNGNLKEFLDMACEKFNLNWEENENQYLNDFKDLEHAIEFAFEIMGNNSPFSRFSNGELSNRFNRSIYELFSYYFCIANIRAGLKDKRELFLQKFEELNANQEFISAVSDTTKDPNKVVARFSLFADMLKSIMGDGIKIPTVSLENGKLKIV